MEVFPMAQGKPKWPSIQEQRAAAKAPRGSALEKLIQANQDFHLLHPDEAKDDVPLPPWIRVHWRKAHPDLVHPSVNPGAGYPDVLHTIHRWMISHPDSPLGSAGDPTKGGKP
jgi:hypothetical protein